MVQMLVVDNHEGMAPQGNIWKASPNKKQGVV